MKYYRTDKMSYIKLKINEHEFSFHEQLHKNLKHLVRANKNDWDFKILISGDGMTRTGKSTLASQLGLFLDPTMNLNRFIFNGDKLIEKSKTIGKSKAIIYDEAKEGLDSKRAMTSYSNIITDYFAECGFLNQFLIIVLPDYFDLNKTVALNQSICLINCKTKNGFERGYFDFYNRSDKRQLYIKGKKNNDYRAKKSSFQGTFVNYFPFDKEEYNKRKLENQRSGKDSKETKTTKKWKTRYMNVIKHLIDMKNYNQKEIAKASSGNGEELTQQGISFILQETNDKE